MKLIPSLLAAAVAVAAFSPVHAQDEAGVTLQVNQGSVMVSQQGGEFATVPASSTVQADSRIMLAEGSAGTLVYSNGCRLRLETPGVHGVPDVAACAAAMAAAPSPAAGAGAVDWQSAGLLFGGTVAVAAILANMDDGDPLPPPPPVSP